MAFEWLALFIFSLSVCYSVLIAGSYCCILPLVYVLDLLYCPRGAGLSRWLFLFVFRGLNAQVLLRGECTYSILIEQETNMLSPSARSGYLHQPAHNSLAAHSSECTA
ncbi:uncharacterized protein B0T15DRAFT_231458 [Chaetomium strumarium]|uniref:Uncharacterized protein n=1 Tax=Chaetomium strumarium TaxID=1170767 RepID=A0AAJ0GQD1_9PEZI|nr:hypothetical protein B0T15DRAFT_231458 [Chaetomium strumarium]